MKLHQLGKLLEIVLFICSQGFVTKDGDYIYCRSDSCYYLHGENV